MASRRWELEKARKAKRAAEIMEKLEAAIAAEDVDAFKTVWESDRYPVLSYLNAKERGRCWMGMIRVLVRKMEEAAND